MNLSYKEEHERFVTNHPGSTFTEVIAIVSYSVLCVALTVVLQYRALTRQKFGLCPMTLFKFDFLGIVCPIILSCTVLSDYINQLLIASCLTSVIVLISEFGPRNAEGLKKSLSQAVPIDRRPSITIFRALVNIISVLCILAVDFKVFPRRYAKTEDYGYSLMDTGVGFYVASHGFVTRARRKDMRLILKSVISSWPLFGLGIVRYLTLETLNYQKHVSEYGTHWNFFFTLGFIKIFGSLVISSWPNRLTTLALLIGLGHLLGLSSGFQSWALSDAPRDDFFSANREGLLSLPGYLCIFLGSVSFGSKMLTEQRSLKNELIFAFKSLLTSLFLFAGSFLFEANVGITRRLANVSYVLWILALSILLITMSIVVELVILILRASNRGAARELKLSLLEAVNYNALFYFLFCNLLTGLVNLSVKTIHKSSYESMAVLIAYALISSAIIQVLYLKRIHVKFW